MMRRYSVPVELRAPLWSGIDPRLRRALRIMAVLGAIMALILSFAPAHKPQHEPRRILERRAARLLTPEKAPPPRSVRTPAAPKPRPRAQAQPKSPVAEKAPASASRRQPTPAPRVARRPAQRRDPEVGKRGREAAQEATRTLKKTTAGIDNLLSSVDGVVPVSGTSSEGASSGAVQKYALAAGRQAEQLESLDGALDAQGAGRGGGSAGVSREGVAIVDDGVRTLGEAADLQGRDTASLMAVVQRYKAGVKFCYDNALKRTAGLQGKITLQMDIDASGRITTLNVASDSLGNRALQKCILSQVKKWRFPKVDGGTVRFTLPLVFSPPESS